MVETLINEAAKYFFHLALVGVCGVIALIWRRIQAMQTGVQMLLMDRLIQEHDFYMEKQSIPVFKKAMFKKKHDAYIGLGVNGVLDHDFEEVMALPTKEEP